MTTLLTSSVAYCVRIEPSSGWSDGYATKQGEWEINDIKFPKIAEVITSLAISQFNMPWVTTQDGRILKLRKKEGADYSWKDVSAKFASSTPSKRVIFKYITADKNGIIWAIDKEGQVYRWANAGRTEEKDN